MKLIWTRIKKKAEPYIDWLKQLKKRYYVLASFVLFIAAMFAFSFAQTSSLNTFVDTSSYLHDYSYTALDSIYNLPLYTSIQKDFLANDIPESQVTKTIPVSQMEGQTLTSTHANYGHLVTDYATSLDTSSDVFLLDEDHPVTIDNTSNVEGIYYFALDYYPLETSTEETKISLTINGEYPFYESQILVLPSQWELSTSTFLLDRYDNEIQPESNAIHEWSTHAIKDIKGLHAGLYGFYLEPGDTIAINYINQDMLIGQFYYVSSVELPSYESYKELHGEAPVIDEEINISARDMLTRSDPSIRLRTEQDPSALYYDTQHLRLNVIYGDSWDKGGQQITYMIDIPTTGYYHLSLKYRQYMIKDLPVYRQIRIDGEVPFDLLESYAFPYTTNFINRTLSDEQGEPLDMYFEAGQHTITLEAVNYPYRAFIETMQYVMNRIQNLALQVKRYTSGGTDLYRDWDIEIYFPDAQADIRSWAVLLEQLYQHVKLLSPLDAPSELANLTVSIDRLNSIADSINELPSLMVQFADGDSSVNQMLGNLMQRMMTSNLELERLVIHGEEEPPLPYSPLLTRLYEESARLVLSFINNPYAISNRSDDEIVVWANFSRQYIEIMQSIIDQKYDGTMRVTLSQMPDENKLILANASGQAPDVALGVNHWIPYDFAARTASLDLRQFEGYEETVSHFSKGAMIPYIFEEGVYGLPLTQNFWVTYYRKDILESIGINEVPQTWDEIIAILPILQSYGMNYFVPLAQYSGLKPYVATLPFIYQFGGDLYSPDGMQTAINSEETLEGITLMSDLFTLYNLPKTVSSFYNNFRYGTLPIGISDLSTYLLMQNVAVELDGLWEMDLHPGVKDEETGEIVRYAASGGQASMIMSSSAHPDESWDFLSWWMSTDIQAEFAFLLQSTYGSSYFWNTSNIDAFKLSSMPQKYKDIVLAQWEFAIEAPRIPGAYMVEREISNAWTSIVFNGTNPRQAIDEAVRVANQEIIYKMAEFGYTSKGEILKEYIVPSIHNVDEWLTEVTYD